MLENKHEYYMSMAYKLAKQAFDEGEIPVGAVIVCNDKIIGKGYNQTERLTDVRFNLSKIFFLLFVKLK